MNFTDHFDQALVLLYLVLFEALHLVEVSKNCYSLFQFESDILIREITRFFFIRTSKIFEAFGCS